MLACDFEYDGIRLSNFGFVLCVFDGNGGLEEIKTGANISFQKVSHHYGKRHSLVGTKYEDCITATFDICKDVSQHEQSMVVSDTEYRALVRWLSRREFLPFRILYEDSRKNTPRYYNASFNITKLEQDGELYGLRLTMETDSPFAYGEEISHSFHVTTANSTYSIENLSDEIGSLYPDITITCLDIGAITLTNKTFGSSMTIKNCTLNEVITVHGAEQIITSSIASHDIANDFNYEFLKLENTYQNRENQISVSARCDITLKYKPILFDTP